jgi:3-oxoacyl-[acyl-carrier protein] reductase
MTATLSSGRLQGRTVLVTGGGSGIGAAIAARAVAEGAHVAVLDYDGDAAARVAGELGDDRALALTADVSKAGEVDGAVGSAVERFKKVDVLMNVAGVYDLGAPAEEVSVDAWDRIFAINVRGTMLMTQRVLREMLPTGSGAIVNVASIAALMGGGGGTAYTSTKGAIASMTRQVAYEVAERGVRVNALAPGVVETPLPESTMKILGASTPNGPQTQHFMAKMMDGAVEAIPMRRFASPSEITGPAIFLASDDASYITGTMLVADGGLTSAI